VIHAELACHAPHGRAVEEGLKPKKAVINCFISFNGSDAGTTRIIKIKIQKDMGYPSR
jgi:hypothetical protein